MSASRAQSWHLDSNELRDLALRLRKEDTTLYREMRAEMRAAAGVAVSAVKASAQAQGMMQAVAATRPTVAITGSKRASVGVVVDPKRAPNARMLELGNRQHGKFLRHPVFGNIDNWVDQPTRPFFYATVAKVSESLNVRIKEIVDRYERRLTE